MIFARTFDLDLVHRTITDPAIYAAMSDDSTVPVEQFVPSDNQYVWYVTVEEAGVYMGLWMFAPLTGICWEAHTCLLPSAWGRSVELAKACAAWLFSNSPCERIIGKVPAHNRLALRLAKLAGFEVFGTNAGAYRKGGVLCDQIWLGLSRP